MSFHRLGLRLAAMVVSAGLAGALQAQQYRFRYYGTEDGLTNLAVKVLFQDRTGFLWAATENDVSRYDGQRLRRYGPAEGLPSEVIVSLGEAPDGSLLAGPEEGVKRAEEMRQCIAQQLFATAADAISLACSFGVGTTNAMETSPQDLVAAADRALYAAKARGRNCVALDSAGDFCIRLPGTLRSL